MGSRSGLCSTAYGSTAGKTLQQGVTLWWGRVTASGAGAGWPPPPLWPGVLLMRGLRALKATVLGCR